jgi:hypothetical protein
MTDDSKRGRKAPLTVCAFLMHRLNFTMEPSSNPSKTSRRPSRGRLPPFPSSAAARIYSLALGFLPGDAKGGPPNSDGPSPAPPLPPDGVTLAPKWGSGRLFGPRGRPHRRVCPGSNLKWTNRRFPSLIHPSRGGGPLRCRCNARRMPQAVAPISPERTPREAVDRAGTRRPEAAAGSPRSYPPLARIFQVSFALRSFLASS